MNKDDFINVLKKDILLSEELSINENTCLLDLYEWDSIAMITAVAVVDKQLQKKISVQEVQNCNTVQDLIDICGI